MGKLKSFRIMLNGDEPVFTPGETIEGNCQVEVIGEIALRSLTVTLRGISKVHWAESRTVGTRLGPYTQHFMSGMEYLREKRVLSQPRFGADRVTLREGKHEFPFSFIIPAGAMPSSFEGKYGSIRYWLRAEILRIRYGNDKTKKTLTILNPHNITLQEYQEPVESAADKTTCCGIFGGGLISISAHTDKSGYSPGDKISISAEFENFTSSRLHPCASLYQRQYFYANERQKMRTKRLVNFKGARLSSKCNSTWANEQLLIPNVTPSILNCSILKVVYYVKISVKIPGSASLATILPVTIGSSTVLTGGSLPLAHMVWLSPPPYEANDLPAYQLSSDDEDDLAPPNSRTHTPPPCYSDIYDSSDTESDSTVPVNARSLDNMVTNL